MMFIQQITSSVSAGDTVTSSYCSTSCSAVYNNKTTLQQCTLIKTNKFYQHFKLASSVNLQLIITDSLVVILSI